ncbi:Na+-driven multidrug efflux pump [Paraburkholderia sp. MM6662-R1]
MTQPSFARAASRPPTLSRHAADTARLAAPLAIAQLSQMAMSVTDTILLGSLGPDALAAGGLGANLFFVVVTLLQGVLTSVSVSVAHARGARDDGRVPHIYWTGFVLSVLLSVPAFILLSFASRILLAVGEPGLLAHNVGRYAAVLRWGAPASLIGVGLMRSFLPAIGAARRLLWVSIASVGVNGFLNYGLIHGAYGLPRLGFLGSAAATTITVWLTALVLMALLHLRPRFRHFVVATRPKLPIRTSLFLQAGVDLSIHPRPSIRLPCHRGTHSAFSGETDCTPINGLVEHYHCGCPGPDSNRAAGLHPLDGEYISCSASQLFEFARCRSDLSLSLPLRPGLRSHAFR